MYCEDLMEQAKGSVGDDRNQLMADAYYANYGLTIVLLKKFGMNERNHDDFIQLSYLAFDKMVRTYSSGSGFTRLSFYRLNLKHECYRYWKDELQYSNYCEDELNTKKEDFRHYNKMIKEVEEEFMDKLLWERAQTKLKSRDFQIIIERFRNEKTLTCIGCTFDLSAERVRQIILRSCSILHEDVFVREIAQYYHFLK